MRYMLLFPGLAILSFMLLLFGGVALPFEFELFGRQVHELEALTVSRGKSLANVVEIYASALVGILACVILRFQWPRWIAKHEWWVISVSFILVLVVYFATPVLPE